MDGEPDAQVDREELVRQIGFAERWLARAREEVTDGRLVRGVLSLLLAEAEVHHARARTAPGPEPAPSRLSPAAAVLGAAVLAAVLVTGFSLWAPRVDVGPVTSGPPVVRLREPVGSTLVLISVPPVPVPAVLEAAPAVPAPAAPSPAPAIRPRRNARPVASGPALTAAPPASDTGTAQTASAAPPLFFSDGELIELVLAAERSLRGAGP